jgi:sugar lactone lactonase YvrE
MKSTSSLSGLAGAVIGGAAALATDVVSPLLGAPAALAVPLCEGLPAVRVLYSGLGVLESAIVDPDGRLFLSNQTSHGLAGSVMRIDHPDAEPVELAAPISSPGGLAFDDSGHLIAGFGDSAYRGLAGNFAGLAGLAGLLRIDPDNGQHTTLVTGLGMANGVARAADGTIFASNDFGTSLDRVDPDGRVHRQWAKVPSANGLAIDSAGRYLYASQTFVPAAIKRIEIADPANITLHAQPPPLARGALLDGLAIDDADRLFVAANGAGQIWRVDPDGTICALARGLRCPSMVALGRGRTGFQAGNLYAVTFHGDVIEFEGAVR